MIDAATVGRLLAARHRSLEAVPDQSLVNVAEVSRTDGWSLRSALVRLAQPEPVRAAAAVELVRRCEAALHPLRRSLERRTVQADRGLSIATLVGEDAEAEPRPLDPEDPYPDTRSADLARLARSNADLFPAVLAAYTGDDPLDDHELEALELFSAVLQLDELAEILTTWAATGDSPPPLASVDAVCASVYDRLEEIGVAPDTGGRERSPGNR